MKPYIQLYYLLLGLSFTTACSTVKKEEKILKEEDTTTPVVLTDRKLSDSAYSTSKPDNKNKNTDSASHLSESRSAKQSKLLTPHQLLLNSLDKSVKVEYAPLDFTIQKNDTTIKAKKGVFQISYTTSSLNDSLVAQELFDYAQHNRKSYLISHNYLTNISIKLNGKNTATRLIEKSIFKNKMDKDFLEKSIIKHPQFLRFDEETNEAVFEFIVGVPNTDWLVVAGINLNEYGNIRIIDIIIPGM